MTKGSVFLIALFVLLYPSAGFCEEADEAIEQLEAAERQLELGRMQLKFQENEAEVEFRRQMRELELEERRIGLEQQRKKLEYSGHRKGRNKEDVAPLLILCFVVHILVAVWVYQDIRKRKAGSGIWIVLALLAGLLGALVYAIVRLGDSRQT